jgi:hypothetical protein
MPNVSFIKLDFVVGIELFACAIFVWRYPRWVESKAKRWVEVIISDLHSHGIDFTPFLVLVSLRSTTLVLHH